MLHRGIEIFMVLVLILSSMGFIIIFRFVESITSLTKQMRQISDENLDKRVTVTKENTEVAELSKTFNELLARLNTAFKREQQFIADVAHELKTPLATMKSSLELSLNKKENAESRSLLKEVDRLSDTLKDVLDLAWTESKEAKLEGKNVQLSELVQDLSEIAEKIAEKKKLIIKKNIEEHIIIHGFKDRIARAFLNIIDNAVKYTQEGTITISLKQRGNSILFIVEDTGGGIPKEDRSHIFTRFYRGKKTNKVFGSGLGLAISKSIVQLHKGTIDVESWEGKGSRFIIILPANETSS
jgi:signal transduction histidine kinase